MIRVIRSSITLPPTKTVIRVGDLTIPWSMPTEREQRRTWREYYRPDPVAEGDA